MQKLSADTLEELKYHLANFGDEFLFRGQGRNYAGSDGTPILNSSFIRKGCIPPLMLKWIFYVGELLRRGGFDTERSDRNNIAQELLHVRSVEP